MPVGSNWPNASNVALWHLRFKIKSHKRDFWVTFDVAESTEADATVIGIDLGQRMLSLLPTDSAIASATIARSSNETNSRVIPGASGPGAYVSVSGPSGSTTCDQPQACLSLRMESAEGAWASRKFNPLPDEQVKAGKLATTITPVVGRPGVLPPLPALGDSYASVFNGFLQAIVRGTHHVLGKPNGGSGYVYYPWQNCFPLRLGIKTGSHHGTSGALGAQATAPQPVFAWEAGRHNAFTDAGRTTPAAFGQAVQSISNGIEYATVVGGGFTLENTSNGPVLRSDGTGSLISSVGLKDDMKCVLYLVARTDNATLGCGFLHSQTRGFWRMGCTGGLFSGLWATDDFSQFSSLELPPQDTQEMQLYSCRLTATGVVAKLNGATLPGAGGPPPPGILTAAPLQLLSDGGNFAGDVKSIQVFDEVTDRQDAAVNADLLTRFSPESASIPDASKPLWVVDGNSIAYGGTCLKNADSYALRSVAALSSPVRVRIKATPGMFTETNASRAPTEIDLLFDPARAFNMVSLQEGTNSFLGSDPATLVLSSYLAWGAGRVARGFAPVVLVDCPAMVGLTSGQAVERASFNTSIAALFGTPSAHPRIWRWSGSGTVGGHFLWKASIVPGLTDPGGADSAAYNDDGGGRKFHWNSVGHGIAFPDWVALFSIAGLV